MACVIHTDRESVAICVACRNEVCEECRTIVEGKNYCPNCLPAPQQQAAQREQAAPPGPPPAPPPATTATSAGTNEILAALSYPIWIIAIIALVLDSTKRDPYVRKHGWTGLFWNIGAFVVYVGLLIVTGIFGAIAGPLAYLMGLAIGCYWLAWLVLSIVFAVKAYKREDFTIPLITDMAAKQYTKAV
ncbi:MAG: DUF4870 domain-containing protein [Armatimonadota bacterium]